MNPIKADGQKGRVLRNMTVTPYKSLPLRGPLQAPLQVPFDLFPEFKPQDLLVEIRAIISDGVSCVRCEGERGVGEEEEEMEWG